MSGREAERMFGGEAERTFGDEADRMFGGETERTCGGEERSQRWRCTPNQPTPMCAWPAWSR